MDYYLNPVAIVVAVVAAVALGFVWYGALFGKKWQALVGLTDAQLQNANMAVTFGSMIFNTFVIAIALNLVINAMALYAAIVYGPDSFIITTFGQSTAVFGALVGLFVGGAFMFTSYTTTYLFAQMRKKLLLIDAGYQVTICVLMGFIIGVALGM
jgi:hypothetical protein